MEGKDMLTFDVFDKVFYTDTSIFEWERADTGWTLEVPLPGFSSSDVSISVQDAAIGIKAKRTNKKKEVAFETTYRMPAQGEVSATMKNGLLTLTITTESKKIDIKIDE